MTNLTELDLAYLPMEEKAFAKNPFPYFQEARKVHPWLATCAFGYVVHGHVAIRDLLGNNEIMKPVYGDDIVRLMGATDTGWGRFQEVQMLNLNGDAHKRIRGAVASMFTPAAARQRRNLMYETMVRLLDEWAPMEAFDFEEFVSYYPISVMSTMLGAPVEDIPKLRRSLEALGLAFGMDKTFMPRVEEGYQVMDKVVQERVTERRAGHRLREEFDLLDMVMNAVEKGQLTEREMYDFLIFAYVGGYDTSKNALTFLMHELLERPEIYERCAQDLAYCTKVVEEGFRFHTTSTFPRLLTRETTYRDVVLPENTMLFFPVSVSGRDPAYFDRPDEFDPDRTIDQETRHLAFGRGAHVCLGQFIARNQIEVGIHLIAQRLKKPRRTGAVGYRPFFGVWGLQGLPIAFEDGGSPTINDPQPQESI